MSDIVRRIERLRPDMLRFALKLTEENYNDAEDVVQEAWIIAWQKASSFRHDGQLASWLFGIVYNRWRALVKRRRQVQSTAFEEVRVEVMDPGDPYETILSEFAAAAEVQRLCLELNPDQQNLFRLLLELKSKKEIAVQLKTTPGNARIQVYRLRQRLKQITS